MLFFCFSSGWIDRVGQSKETKTLFLLFISPERRKGSNLNISFHPLDKWGREKRLRQKEKQQQLEREKGVFFFP
jgi:hypothetical protein